MMMKRIATATALASLLAAPAFAGALIFEPAPEPEVVVAPPAPPPPALPTWSGGYVGGTLGWAWGRLSQDDEDGVTFRQRDNGFNYGAQAGFDFDAGGFVVGGEAAYERPRVSFDEGDMNQLVRLTARAGVPFGNTLAYVRGGGAWVDTDFGNEWGWTAGAGVEQLITDNISAGLEYNFHRFTGFDVDDGRLNHQTVGARVNFRF
jgi:outer membrane immunogenic protein